MGLDYSGVKALVNCNQVLCELESCRSNWIFFLVVPRCGTSMSGISPVLVFLSILENLFMALQDNVKKEFFYNIKFRKYFEMQMQKNFF